VQLLGSIKLEIHEKQLLLGQFGWEYLSNHSLHNLLLIKLYSLANSIYEVRQVNFIRRK